MLTRKRARDTGTLPQVSVSAPKRPARPRSQSEEVLSWQLCLDQPQASQPAGQGPEQQSGSSGGQEATVPADKAGRSAYATKALCVLLGKSERADRVLKRTKTLIEMGANPNGLLGYDNSPLCIANDRHQLELAQVLLEAKANPDAMGRCRWTVLHDACLNNRLDWVRLLLKHGANPALGMCRWHCDLSWVGQHLTTPFLVACSAADHGVVTSLLDATKSVADLEPATDVHHSANGCPGQEVEMLLDRHMADAARHALIKGATPPQSASEELWLCDRRLQWFPCSALSDLSAVLASNQAETRSLLADCCSRWPLDVMRIVEGYRGTGEWLYRKIQDVVCTRRQLEYERAKLDCEREERHLTRLQEVVQRSKTSWHLAQSRTKASASDW